MKRKNPLKAILDIRKPELPLALLMLSYFFLVITSFWILKPIKKSLFIEFNDKDSFKLRHLEINNRPIFGQGFCLSSVL